VGALAVDTELLGDVSNGTAIAEDPSDQQQTTVDGQASISVGHEDLLVGEDLDISTKPGGPPFHKTRNVNNVPAEYI
jgi:hypothetical protein